MTDNAMYEQQVAPNPDMKSLDRLIGTWKVTGGAEGQIRYEWMDGGFFLMQHFDFNHGDHQVKGIEMIGHLQGFGEAPSQDIKSRIYDNMGNTFDYIYEMDGDTLNIYAGSRDSGAYYRGTLSADGNTLSGAWTYPGGGGYEATAVRIK